MKKINTVCCLPGALLMAAGLSMQPAFGAAVSGAQKAVSPSRAVTAEHTIALFAEAFEAKRPEQITPFLAHYSALVSEGAAVALARKGPAVVPLLKKLLCDTSPYMRAGAIVAFAEMYGIKDDVKGKKDGAEKRKAVQMTPELREVIDMISSMKNDSNSEMQRAMATFYMALNLENEEVLNVMVALARSPDYDLKRVAAPHVRSDNLIRDPKTKLLIATAILSDPGNMANGIQNHDLDGICLWLQSQIVDQGKKGYDVRPVVPAICKYLRYYAHERNGFFSNGPYERGYPVIKYYYDKDPQLEKTENVVEAVCTGMNRIPYSGWRGWVRSREFAVDIFRKFSPATIPAAEACVAVERKWTAEQLANLDQPQIAPQGDDNKPDATEKKMDSSKAEALAAAKLAEEKKSYEIRLTYLEDMVAWLKAGKPEGKEPVYNGPPVQVTKRTKQDEENKRKAAEAGKKTK